MSETQNQIEVEGARAYAKAVVKTEAKGSRQENVKALRNAPEYTRGEGRQLVDTYEGVQRLRIATQNRLRAHAQDRAVTAVPLQAQLEAQLAERENTIAAMAHEFALRFPEGRWALSQAGVGPVIAATLVAYLGDLEYRPKGYSEFDQAIPVRTVGQIWRFAGLDPTAEWKKGQRRPHCARLKTICWMLGESFKKLGKDSTSFYSKLYRERKATEIMRNERGDFKDQALNRLEKAKLMRWKISPEQSDTWASGKLQAIGLDLRAERVAVKMFLSHFFEIAYLSKHGTRPPVPFAFATPGSNHNHYIAPPGIEEFEVKPSALALKPNKKRKPKA